MEVGWFGWARSPSLAGGVFANGGSARSVPGRGAGAGGRQATAKLHMDVCDAKWVPME